MAVDAGGRLEDKGRAPAGLQAKRETPAWRAITSAHAPAAFSTTGAS
jgi:hypothetical protein